MVIKRVSPVSAAKIGGVLYAGLGLIVGACVSLIMMAAGGAAAVSGEESGGAVVGMIFGAGAIIIMPILYGVLGFVVMLISAALYNLAARLAGGIEVELQ